MMWLRSGLLVDPLNLTRDISRVTIPDMAHALAHVNRWGGHADPPISVALHSLACAREALRRSPRLALLALHHDDGEAFFGDMCRDLKGEPGMSWYREQERAATEICVRHFAPAVADIPLEAIKEIDTRSLLWERARCFPATKEDASYHPELSPLTDAHFYVAPDSTVEASWIELHDRLTRLVS